MGDKVYKGDVGTIIQVDCNEDLSTATGTYLKVRKPDGTIVSWAASIYATYYLRYTTILGDVDIDGIYKIQPFLTLGGWTGRGKTCHLPVHEHFD